jgi:hypothetical protein
LQPLGGFSRQFKKIFPEVFKIIFSLDDAFNLTKQEGLRQIFLWLPFDDVEDRVGLEKSIEGAELKTKD